MSSFNVNLGFIDDGEITRVINSRPTVNMRRGDSLVMTRSSGVSSAGINVGNFASSANISYWVYVPAPVNLPLSGSVTRTIAANAPAGTHVLTVNFLGSGEPTTTITVTVVSSDTTPDTIVWQGLGNLNPGSQATSARSQITGIESAALVSIVGGTFSINSSTNFSSTSRTVNPNQFIRLRSTASPLYNTNLSVQLTVGGVVSSWIVGTKSDPDDGQKIFFSIPANQPSTSISLRALGDFFGRSQSTRTSLLDYVVGGNFVPNISENFRISLKLPLSLDTFRGSATTLYWTKTPSSKFVRFNSSRTAGALEVNFGSFQEGSNDFDVGYNARMRENVEYRYVVNYTLGDNTGITQSGGSSTFTRNQQIILRKTFLANKGEEFIRGYVDITARHVLYPSVQITTRGYFDFLIYQ